MKLINDIPHYLQLMRFDKPIGWLLLLWPTLWAVWIASDGQPDAYYVWIFTLGVIVMRSAGCVINDYADRDIDPLVQRTTQRPLAAGTLATHQALGLLFVLLLIALGLLLLLPSRVWPWSIPAVFLAGIYPFMKRFFDAPQLILGLAFSFGIPMAYVTFEHALDMVFWALFVANVCWVLVFDTVYAMSDREDDLKVGVRSTAILFGKYDRLIVGLLQLVVLALMVYIYFMLQLEPTFLAGLAIAGGMFIFQQRLIAKRDRADCFAAFINNGWVGGIIWFGLISAL